MSVCELRSSGVVRRSLVRSAKNFRGHPPSQWRPTFLGVQVDGSGMIYDGLFVLAEVDMGPTSFVPGPPIVRVQLDRFGEVAHCLRDRLVPEMAIGAHLPSLDQLRVLVDQRGVAQDRSIEVVHKAKGID